MPKFNWITDRIESSIKSGTYDDIGRLSYQSVQLVTTPHEGLCISKKNISLSGEAEGIHIPHYYLPFSAFPLEISPTLVFKISGFFVCGLYKYLVSS